MKLCKDCKHCVRPILFGDALAKCGATIDLVSGGAASYCQNQRDIRYDGFTLCGSDGKLFEPKQKSLFARLFCAVLSMKS